MMEIKFQTKEESNKQQQEDFLKLSKVVRHFARTGKINEFHIKYISNYGHI